MKNLLTKVVAELNEMEKILKEEILEAREYYGNHTDDAEMYIGQLFDKHDKRVDDLLEQYDPENILVGFDNGKWFVK